MSSVGGGSIGGGSVDRDIQAQFRRQSSAQCKRIASEIAGNLELQSLVLATIEKYNKGTGADGKIQHLASAVQTTPAKRRKP